MRILSAASLVFFLVHVSYAQQQIGSRGDAIILEQNAPQYIELAQAENTLSDSEQRELEAGEDPRDITDAEREERRQSNEVTPARTVGYEIYGSVRLRNPEEEGVQDVGSRAGLGFEIPLFEKSYAFTRYEAGFDALSVFNANDEESNFRDTVSKRLGYIGLDVPWTDLIIGKNWSTYYEIGAFTDRFTNTGGEGSGVFNANTDGGATGTGRAESVLQTKVSLGFLPHKIFKPFELNIQVQNGNPIPFGGGAEYGTTYGVSSVLVTQNNLTIGVAYNFADVDLVTSPSLRDIGIMGPAEALLVGTRAFGDRWYAGLVFGEFKNHEATDQGIYFDGWGSELYGQVRLSNRWWIVGGYNILEPDNDQPQAGEYRIRYAIAGVRFTFDKFRRMIFANIRFNDNSDTDGASYSDVFTVGLRWDISKREWHAPNN